MPPLRQQVIKYTNLYKAYEHFDALDDKCNIICCHKAEVLYYCHLTLVLRR